LTRPKIIWYNFGAKIENFCFQFLLETKVLYFVEFFNENIFYAEFFL